ncbi:UNVERIFIED_CONTAM: hypothetical protein FKN15_005839 [Acipenser sinensis]
MDVSVSVSFFQDELASTIEHAVKAAVDTVLCEITKVVGGKFTEFQMEMAGKEKENESLKLRLEISESELKAVRECMNAADADIKQPLGNMNPDCNEQDFQRNENQGLFQESELKAVRECMNAADADIKQPLRNMNPDCNEQDFQRNENQGLFQDPKESHAMPKSEAQEGPRIEAVYTQEESFDQEWCASLKQVTELTCVKDEEVPRLECVPIKEEFIEQECVPIAEEVPAENNVCTLKENNQLGSSLCDDCPPECELGFIECWYPLRSTSVPCIGPGVKVDKDQCKALHCCITDAPCFRGEPDYPKESHAMPKSEAHERPRIKAVYTQEESFDQEWCASLKQVTELTSVKDEEVPRLECVPIKEQECVSIAEEVPTENNVCTLEENNQLGSSLCDDCPPECELGFRATKGNHTRGTPFPCADCGKRFSCLSQLKIHQRVHTGEKPHHCTECGRSFTQLQNLKIHQRVHTGEKPHHCTECGRSFTQLQNLKIHQRVHTGEKPHHCTECGRSFTQLQNLKIHQRVHTGEKPYHCTECGKSFTRLESLQSHQRSHTGEKPYHCAKCGKRFSRLSNVKRHQSSHTREKLYHCAE